MDDPEAVLGWIRGQAAGAHGRSSPSARGRCCVGAAGLLLKGRRATTHWASFHLLAVCSAAIPVDERVVVDGRAGSSPPASRPASMARCDSPRNCVACKRRS